VAAARRDIVMTLTPIGIIHSPHRQATGTPVQAAVAAGVRGRVEVFPEYATGLRDLDGFERIWLVYWFDRAKPVELVVTPYLDTRPHGLFATRAPCRPNPIGLSAVRLVRIVGNTLQVDGLDILDNTPLLDIKPYIPAFDALEAKRIGWCAEAQGSGTTADGRFEAGGPGMTGRHS
jgi:tRNA (adenine37-N6)-methyltransferase